MPASLHRAVARHAVRWGVASGALAFGACGGGESAGPAPQRTLLVVLPVQSLEEGQAIRATAYVEDGRGAREEVLAREWSVTSPSLRVSAPGEITAVSAGSGKVIATHNGLRGEATLTVHRVRVARVELAPVRDGIDLGGTLQFSTTITDAGGQALAGRAVAWTSSDSSIAAVSPQGLVTARTVGGVRISARADSVTGFVDLYVRDPLRSVATIEVTPFISRMSAGDSVQLNVTTRDTAGRQLIDREITWLVTTAGSRGAARLTESAMLVALEPGRVNIEVLSEGRRTLLTVDIADNTDPSIVVTFAKPLEGAVVGDTMPIYVSVDHPNAPLARVVAVLNERSVVLQKVPVGFNGLGEAWVGTLNVQDLRYGAYELVVSATDARGRLGIGRQRFNRDVDRSEGGTTRPPRSK